MHDSALDRLDPPGLVRAAWLIARKDLSIEFRTRTAFLSALVFALLGITIFYFAWDPTAVSAMDLAPGVLWVIFTFSALLGLQRSFGIEQADRAIDALLAAPVDREALYIGKALGNLVFVTGIEAVTLPAVALFYNLPIGDVVLPLASVAFLAGVGIVAVGTLFSSMAVNTKLAELLLPMLSLPFFLPVVMAASKTSAHLLSGQAVAGAWPWIRILLGFDLVFIVVSAFLFPYTVQE